MEALERLRQRLDTIGDLGALVRTMKALAQVNIQQAEHAAHAVQMYLRTVELALRALTLPAMRPPPPPGIAPGAPQGLIVFGSDHGLCGRFNEDVARHAIDRIAQARLTGATVRVLAAGARAAACLAGAGEAPEEVLAIPATAAGAADTVRALLTRLDAWQAQDVARVSLCHNRPVTTARYEAVSQPMLPVDLRSIATVCAGWPARGRPMYTMARAPLLAAAMRQWLFVVLYRAAAESLAAEHGARLAAMRAAERSLAERDAELTTEFRRRRQEQITAEMLDVVSGYETIAREAGS